MLHHFEIWPLIDCFHNRLDQRVVYISSGMIYSMCERAHNLLDCKTTYCSISSHERSRIFSGVKFLCPRYVCRARHHENFASSDTTPYALYKGVTARCRQLDCARKRGSDLV